MGNSPKKVLFIITKGNFGGAQRYVYDLAVSLPKELFTPIVAFGQSSLLKKKLEEKGIETIEVKSFQRDINPVLEFRALKEVYDIIKKENPDIVHVNSSKAGGIGSLAGRLCGTRRIIFTAHNWAWNEKRNLLSKILIVLGHWFTVLLSHKIICVSEETARQGRRLPFASGKIVVIHNGIGEIEFNQRENTKKTIGMIAELHENKGIDIALKAFDLISDTDSELAIIGNGEKTDQYTKLKDSLKSKDRIHFVGFVENASRHLKDFDIFLLPSRNEALPYVLLEAGLASLPVIATKVGGVPEIIVDKETGILIPKENPQALAIAIEDLIKNPEKAAGYGTKLKERISSQFSLSIMVQKTIGLYNE